MEKKKLKDTKLGGWLKDNGPHILKEMGGVVLDATGLGALKSVLKLDTTMEPAKQMEALDMVRQHEIEMERLANEDRNSAREMQKQALIQDDVFSKRFLYYLAAGSLLLGFAYVFFITFAEIPAENQRFADTILGVVIATIITTIYNFFFGSSKGSKDKDPKKIIR